MPKKTITTLVVLAIGISTIASANLKNASAGQIEIPLNQALVMEGGESTNPRTYDPHTTHGSGDKRVFSGLVSFDPQLNLTPDLAESWDVSDDGMTYTFHLRENAGFHNGRMVTAQDFVYSLERAASPALASDTALTYLGDIAGAKEFASGSEDHIAGITALDEHTLQIMIDAPKPYFPLKLTYPTAFVLDRENVESGDEWYRQPNGTGPYRLTEWISFERIVYEANQDFYLGAPSIQYIVVNLYTGNSQRLYESGDVDIAGVFSIERFSDPTEPLHNELRTGVSLCTGYVVFDSTQPPFDDVNVRKAFSMAFNRQQYGLSGVSRGDDQRGASRGAEGAGRGGHRADQCLHRPPRARYRQPADAGDRADERRGAGVSPGVRRDHAAPRHGGSAGQRRLHRAVGRPAHPPGPGPAGGAIDPGAGMR
jgi:ABC-type transport system substrate-binding protein